jgi:hypothetical protein
MMFKCARCKTVVEGQAAMVAHAEAKREDGVIATAVDTMVKAADPQGDMEAPADGAHGYAEAA